MPAIEAFDIAQPSPELAIGQLSDDVDRVRALLAGTEIVAVWHELSDGVLRAVEALDQP